MHANVGQGKPSRSGPVIIMIIIDERRCDPASVQLDLVIRYALGHSHIRGRRPSHRARPGADDPEFRPSLKSIHANEIGNGNGTVSASASAVVRAMVSEVHGVDHDTLPGLA